MDLHNKDLFDAFVFDIYDALEGFEQAVVKLNQDFAQDHLKELSVLAHRIKGTAALYEYPQLSKLAALVERLMDYGPQFSDHRVSLVAFLEQAALCFRAGLEHITEKGREGTIGLQLTYLGGAGLLKKLLKENKDIFAAKVQTPQAVLPFELNLTQDLRQFYASNQDTWEFFVPEAQEHLDKIQGILETKEVSKEDIHQLFRSTHTLKGAAYMIDFKPVGDLSHQLEDLMVMVREGTQPFDDQMRDALGQGHQLLKQMLATAEGQDVDVVSSYARVTRLLQKRLGYEAAENALIVEFRQFKRNHAEVWEYFVPEVQEHLTAFQAALEQIHQEGKNEESLTTLFRSVHTIKGSAYTVGLQQMGDVAKHLEAVSKSLREESDVEVADVHEALEKGHQVLSLVLASLEEEQLIEPTLEQFNNLVASLGLLEAVKTQHKTELKGGTIRVGLNKIDRLMNLANDMVMTRARLQDQLQRFNDMSESLEMSRLRMLRTTSDFEEKYLNPRLREQISQTVQSSKGNGLHTSLANTFDELEFDSYSDLNILARAISEMGSDLNEVQQQFNRFRQDFSQELNLVERLSRGLRSEVSRTRLVPVSQLFNRLKRLVKESQDKHYELNLKGEAVEIDASILEGLSDSMIHLVKNAIAHGIESKEERLRLGKSSSGHIHLNAYPQGNSVIIEIYDDGAGINVEAVKTQAILRGLLSADEVAKLDDQGAMSLIFLAGLSTAKAVTTEAGRGVGMDVVASNVRQLGGDVSVSSQMGQGTRFKLRLPLTLLVSEVLMVRIAGQTMAFPINTVKTLRYIPSHQLAGETVAIAERLLPLYRAHELLGGEPPSQSEQAVVVLESSQGSMALVVDEFVHMEEISMRSLGQTLKGLGYIAGATLSGQGEVILLLDPDGLRSLSFANAVVTAPLQSQEAIQNLRLLLVDDSISVRKVLSKMLSRNDYTVVTANDGQEALEILRSQTFDVILTDLEMPRLNGYELIEDVRRTFSAEDLPIVVMTTRAGDKHRQLALDLGANHYFSKPIDEFKLLNFLRDLKPQSARLKFD